MNAARVSETRLSPEVLIGSGLVTLLAGSWWPNLPVVSPVSVIGCGAMLATLNLFRGRPSLPLAMAVQVFVYSCIYFVFVGCVCDAALKATPWSQILAALDVSLSLLPIVLMLRRSVEACDSAC